MSELSKAAEGFVCDWLTENNWVILARNFRIRRAEVDIIAKKSGVLSFIEVKFAADNSATMPLEKIDAQKQARITLAASAYTSLHTVESEIRFDVAVVTGSADEFRMKIYIEDAFRPVTAL